MSLVVKLLFRLEDGNINQIRGRWDSELKTNDSVQRGGGKFSFRDETHHDTSMKVYFFFLRQNVLWPQEGFLTMDLLGQKSLLQGASESGKSEAKKGGKAAVFHMLAPLLLRSDHFRWRFWEIENGSYPGRLTWFTWEYTGKGKTSEPNHHFQVLC